MTSDRYVTNGSIIDLSDLNDRGIEEKISALGSQQYTSVRLNCKKIIRLIVVLDIVSLF